MRPDAFIVQDGARLPYLAWGPDDGRPWAVVVGLHGMNDDKMSFHMAGPAWAAMGIQTYAYDQRGFGFAEGRGLWPGERLMVEDLRTVVDLVRARHPGAIIAVAGESMGGAVTISAFASDDPPAADRAILLAPAVWGWSSQSPLNRAALRTVAAVMGPVAPRPPSWGARLYQASDNIDELYRMGRDPGSILETRFDALAGLVDLMESASLKLGSVKGPTLMLYGGKDRVITPAPTRLALERAGAPPNLRTGFHPEGWHLLNRDLQRERVFADVAAFLRNPEAALPSGAGPVLAALEALPSR